MSKVTLKGHIIVPQIDLIVVKNELATHLLLTRQESGCLVFDVTQDSQNENRFDVYEEFADQHSFSNHQDRVSNSKWGSVTCNVQRHYKITGVK